MTHQLSRSDIRFLQTIFSINKVFAIVPSYNFDKARITHPVLNKIQAYAYPILIISGGIFCLYIRRLEHAMYFTILKMILDYIREAFLYQLTVSIILSSCLLNKKKWLKLLNAFVQIDKRFNTRNEKAKTFTEQATFQLVLCNVTFIGCFVFLMYAIHASTDFQTTNTYWMDMICLYYHLLVLLLVFNMGRAFECRYKKLNRVLEENVINVARRDNSVREIGRLCRKLGGMVGSHNKIFGWSLVGCLGLSVANILMCFNMIVFDNLFVQVDVLSRVACSVLALFTLVSTSMVVMSCDFASRESKKTTSLCYKLQEHLPAQSPERRELLLLAKISAHNVARFTAADFFELNRNTLCCILGTTTTYLIVMIQFNHNSAKE